jgi:hypothetical protein
MAENEVQTLEKGDIYFFYRPRVEEYDPEGLSDIQRFYMVLSTGDRYRLMVVGHKRLPKPEKSGGRKHWGFVEMVRKDPKSVTDELSGAEYGTKTRGQRHLPQARPAGEGVYRILRHGDHTHLVFELELPEEPGEVQKELQLEKEASYIISVKNPERSGPKTPGLSSDKEARFPQKLMDVFRGRKFADADPPEFLDHEGAEFVLISASDDIGAELGIELDAEHESLGSAEIFRDLKMDREKKPVEPLLKGEWK